MKKIPLLLLALALGLAAAPGRAQAIKIGDPAPKIEPQHWLKGAPVSSYQPGRVYVVEFWATWCVPCKENIPHLTELQKKFADRVTVIGIDVRERQMGVASLQSVQAFVEKLGAQMDYTVAMDDPVNNTVFKAWMEAAGIEGIPTAFVVDGTGRITWLGHPRAGGPELEAAVVAALDHKVNVAGTTAQQAAMLAAEAKRIEHSKRGRFTEDCLRRRDYVPLREAGRKLQADPDRYIRMEGDVLVFLATIGLDQPAAEQQLRAVFAEANQPQVDFAVAVGRYAALLPHSFGEFTISQLEQVPEKTNLLRYSVVADIYCHWGDAAKAVEAFDRMVAIVRQGRAPSQSYLDALATRREKYATAKPPPAS